MKNPHVEIDPYCKEYEPGTVTRKGFVCIDCLIYDNQRRAKKNMVPDYDRPRRIRGA